MSAGGGHRARGAERGFSYVEVLVSVALVAAVLLPALDAIDVGVRGAAEHGAVAARQLSLRGKMEELLAKPYATLDAAAVAAGSASVATSFSDAAGTPGRRLVFMARWDVDNADADGDPLTGGEDGLLWIGVRREGEQALLETLTGR